MLSLGLALASLPARNLLSVVATPTPPAGVTFSPTDHGSNVVLSADKLTVSTTAGNTLARINCVVPRSTGQYYFESTYVSVNSGGSNQSLSGAYIAQTDYTNFNAAIPGLYDTQNGQACCSLFDNNGGSTGLYNGSFHSGAPMMSPLPFTVGYLLDSDNLTLGLIADQMPSPDYPHPYQRLQTVASNLAGDITVGVFLNQATLSLNVGGSPFVYASGGTIPAYLKLLPQRGLFGSS